MNEKIEKVMQILKTAEGENYCISVPKSDLNAYVAILEISPDIAKELLVFNQHNRPESKAYVNRYAKVMKEGNWLFNAQPIIFAEDGFILDGQHRLEACVAAETSFVTMVVVNLNDSIFTTIDCGRTRTVAQLLAIGNVPNSAAVAAVVRSYTALKNGMKIINRNARSEFSEGPATKKNNTEMVNIYNDNSDEFNMYGQRAVQLNQAVKRHPISGSLAAAYWMYLVKDKGYDDAFVEKFFRMLYSYETAENENVNLLRIKFSDMRSGVTAHQTKERQNYMMSAEYKRNLLAVVWNYYATNRAPVKVLTFQTKDGDIEFLSAAQAGAMKN